MEDLAPDVDLSPYIRAVASIRPIRAVGSVSRVVGLTIESDGPASSVGEECLITDQSGRSGKICRAEVVGFNGHRVLTMPVDRADAIRYGDPVVALRSRPGVHVSDDLLGRTLDATGALIDGLGPCVRGEWRSLHAEPPAPMTRPAILERLRALIPT